MHAEIWRLKMMHFHWLIWCSLVIRKHSHVQDRSTYFPNSTQSPHDLQPQISIIDQDFDGWRSWCRQEQVLKIDGVVGVKKIRLLALCFQICVMQSWTMSYTKPHVVSFLLRLPQTAPATVFTSSLFCFSCAFSWLSAFYCDSWTTSSLRAPRAPLVTTAWMWVTSDKAYSSDGVT